MNLYFGKTLLKVPPFAVRGAGGAGGVMGPSDFVLCLPRPTVGMPALATSNSSPGTKTVHTHTSNSAVPRRAMMYVPGSDERKLKKIPSLGCDCAVMDMEDGVAQGRKEEARDNICKALKEIDLSSIPDVAVRINSVSSGLAEDDLLSLQQAEVLPRTLMLPKLDTFDEAKWFAGTVKQLFQKRRDCEPFRLVTFVESAVGLLDLREILSRVIKMSCCAEKDGAPYVLEGVVFGSDDLLASIGATRTTDAMELIYARQKVVLIAKALQLQAIDLVHIDYKDQEGLRLQSEEGARMGFTGKQVIHPDQVAIVQKAFSPSEETIRWAEELVKAFDHHQKDGTGAFTFQGKMIDMPLLRQANNVLTCHELRLKHEK